MGWKGQNKVPKKVRGTCRGGQKGRKEVPKTVPAITLQTLPHPRHVPTALEEVALSQATPSASKPLSLVNPNRWWRCYTYFYLLDTFLLPSACTFILPSP